MPLRPTQASTYALVRSGLDINLAKMIRAQEQVATGLRIVRPSDDPVGAAQADSLRGRIESTERYSAAIASGRSLLDTAAGALQESSGLVSEARSLVLQAVSGVLAPEDRTLLADQIELIRDRLLDLANTRSGSRYLFSGTEIGERPFQNAEFDGVRRAQYHGNDGGQQLLVGTTMKIEVNVPGDRVFSRTQDAGTEFGNLTGVAGGTTPDGGDGYAFLEMRHDGTTGTPAAGLALVNAGASDTILGNHNVVVDVAAGTVQLSNGTAVAIPAPTDPNVADFVVKDAAGAEVHLDFTGFTGVNANFTLTGDGSASLDGTTFTALTFSQTDLMLTHSGTGAVVHIDDTQVRRAGEELVVFGGAVNLFDTLQALTDVLRNEGDIDVREMQARSDILLGELDRNHENVITGLGTLGTRSSRLEGLSSSYQDVDLHLRSLLSNVEDADFNEVVLDLTRAEQTLQQTQLVSTRLLQQSLLNFLR